MIVFVVVQSWGTCPSDSMESVDEAFMVKADADRYVASRPAAGRSGPFYEIVECSLWADGEQPPPVDPAS